MYMLYIESYMPAAVCLVIIYVRASGVCIKTLTAIVTEIPICSIYHSLGCQVHRWQSSTSLSAWLAAVGRWRVHLLLHSYTFLLVVVIVVVSGKKWSLTTKK